MSISLFDGLENHLSVTEVELVLEAFRSLRRIRHAYVNLTVHDGRPVEIQKVERIRMASRSEGVIANAKQQTQTEEANSRLGRPHRISAGVLPANQTQGREI